MVACALVTSASPLAAWGDNAEVPSRQPLPVTGEITRKPSLAKDVAPGFPARALVARMEATVVLSLDIAADGSIDLASLSSVQVTTEAGEAFGGDDEFGFGAAALAAGQTLVFHPAEVDGVPVAVRVTYTYSFQLPAETERLRVVSAEDVLGASSALAPEPAEVPAVINFEGQLVERGNRSAVAGVVITVYQEQGEKPLAFETTTDAKGHFAFYDLAVGEWQILAERTGYIPYKTSERISSGEGVSATYYFERGRYSAYDVDVEADRPRKEVSRRRLVRADIEKVPGTLGDPVLVVENLPGVARGAVGEVIVRGSGPNDTGLYFEGTNIPLIYHFGGLKSIFPAKLIDSVDFYPGNFSVAYGRAMGGILDLRLKGLNPDGFHGSVDVSVLDTSIYLEVPITEKLAIGIAGRRSYIGTVLDAAIPKDAGVGLVTAPKYHDYQFFGSYRPANEHEFRWLLLGSGDAFEAVFDEPSFDTVNSGASTSNVAAKTSVTRLNLEHRYTPNEMVSNKLRIGLGKEATSASIFGNTGVDFDFSSISARDALTLRVSKELAFDVGFDFEFYTVGGTLNLPPLDREGEGQSGFNPNEALKAEYDDLAYTAIAPYIEAEIKLGDVTLVPGLRTDYFGLTKSWSVDPRLVARYDADSWALKGGAAVVHQDPFFPDIDSVFGNPDLDLQRAYQYSAGGEWSPLDHIKAEATVFYKDMRNLVGRSEEFIARDGAQVPEKLANNTVGRVYGAEVFVEHSFSNSFRGWLSYSLSRAERKGPRDEDYRLFDYDQTHILAAVGNYSLPQNWEVGFRWRYVSGNLNTPVVDSVFNSDRNAYTPVFGDVNSSRLPSFHQLDLRVDKTWIFDTWKLSSYLSLINSYNRDNADSVSHNFDFSEKSSNSGLPLLPIFGLKGEW